MSLYDEALVQVLRIEGPESNIQGDAGGRTIYGIAENEHPEMWANGAPSYDQAVAFYRREVWDKLRLDDIGLKSEALAFLMFRIGVNPSPEHAAEWLQRSLNVFNRQQKDYRDVVVDRIVGDATLLALGAYLHFRGAPGERVLLAAMRALYGAYFVLVAERHANDEDFVYGWFLQRVLA